MDGQGKCCEVTYICVMLQRQIDPIISAIRWGRSAMSERTLCATVVTCKMPENNEKKLAQSYSPRGPMFPSRQCSDASATPPGQASSAVDMPNVGL